MLLLVMLLVVLAIVTGALGFRIKGAFWLLIIALVFLVAAFLFGRSSSRR